jgi:U3 small nucleolar RNA-associated protein 13
LWSTKDLSLVGTLKGHKRGVMQSCFSPANKSIATASGDRTIKIWSLVDYSCLNTLQGHSGSVCQVGYLNKYGLQVVSTGSDGLLKIWTIKSGECDNTFDAHDDKVWALAVSSQEEGVLVTGGADSVVKMWKDVTRDKVRDIFVFFSFFFPDNFLFFKKQEDEQLLESEAKILKEQELMRSMHTKDYKKAVEFAFELNHSYKLWNIFSEIMEQENGAALLNELIVTFDNDRIVKCLGFVREWNTNATKSYVAQHILSAILKAFPFVKLKKIPGLLDLLNGLIPYTERHFQRVDRLAQASFLIDYSCAVMSSIQQGGEFGKMEDVRTI